MGFKVLDSSPIIACSTGNLTNSAIAVIRLSGFKNLDFLKGSTSLSPHKIKPRYAHYLKIISGKKIIDEVVLTYFPGPHSYNGENILELSVHGNIFNINRIIDLYLTCGFRKAEPGEFTLRALKNKKLSLAQVEGLDLMLNATSVFTLEQGLSLFNGDLQIEFRNLLDTFTNHKSALELGIDFLDDVGEEGFQKNFDSTLKSYLDCVKKLHKHSQNLGGNLLRPEIVLWGLPNAGKSSLFNAILSKNRSIVSSEKGTTRDYISEDVMVKDVLYRLVDTAGIRDSVNAIESEGIFKAKALAKTSFFNILVIDPKEIPTFEFNFLKGKIDLIVFSHLDEGVLGPIGAKEIISKFELNNYSHLDLGKELDLGPIGAEISSKFNKIASLQPLVVERHKDSINKIYDFSTKYIELSTKTKDISIISNELNLVGHCILELVGIVSPDTVLNNIFANFCIGK